MSYKWRGVKERIPIWIPLLKSSFNFYFIEWALLVPVVTFEQVSESSSSLEKAGKVSISLYLQL